MHKILGKKGFYIRIESSSIGVTGSCNYLVFHLPNGKETRILIDCGMFLENEETELNREFSFDCKKLLAVFITHEHSDHCARIPCLYANGFTGKIYASEYASQKIKTDAIKNYYSMRRTFEPQLYSEEDATTTIRNTFSLQIGVEFQLNDNIFVTPLENAHTKGAVMYLIRFEYKDNVIRVLFTGDYKRTNIAKKSYFPMIGEKYNETITIITEATHGAQKEPKKIFQSEVIKAILEGKSVVIIANGETRYETVSNELKQMKDTGKIPSSIPIFLQLKKNFNMENLNSSVLPSNTRIVKTTEEKQTALYERNPKIIISTNRGYTDSLLKSTIENPRYLIFYTNYVSKGSRGDKLLRTPTCSTIEMGRQLYTKKAEVKKTEEYSDHDFWEGLANLLHGFRNINAIFLEHGDAESKEKLRQELLKELPKLKVITLERGKAYRITENGVRCSK